MKYDIWKFLQCLRSDRFNPKSPSESDFGFDFKFGFGENAILLLATGAPLRAA